MPLNSVTDTLLTHARTIPQTIPTRSPHHLPHQCDPAKAKNYPAKTRKSFADHSQIIRKSFADHSAALTLPGRIDTQIIPCQSQIIRRSLGHKKTPPVGGVKPKGGAEGEIRSLTRVNNKQLQTINKYRQEGDNLP